MGGFEVNKNETTIQRDGEGWREREIERERLRGTDWPYFFV